MKMQKLRKIIFDFPKFPKTKFTKPDSVCNVGFPGNFNISFMEAKWIEKFNGQYLNYDHDLIISNIQPCIRHQDWETILNDSKNRHRYLSVFEMADIGGSMSLVDNEKMDEVVSFSIKGLYDFLVDKVGLSRENLRIEYCAGGVIKDLTKNKYPLNKKISSDKYIRYWKEFGIKANQFIPDKTRDTLLALHIYGIPTPWGYRNEILYKHNNELIDIGTFECLCYRPIFNDKKEIIDIKPWEHCFVVSAIGIERVLMVANRYKSIMDCDHIKPILNQILSYSKYKDLASATIFTEAIRTIHRIVTDCGGYKKLSKKRKQKIRAYFRSLLISSKKLKLIINKIVLADILKINAQSQDYYPELLNSIKKTAEEILLANERFKKDKSIKIRDIAQQ